MTHHRQKTDRWLFVLLCVLMVWAPIPLGSGRAWSAAILNIGYGSIVLGLAWQLAHQTLSPAPALRQAWPASALFFAIPLWSAVQLLGVTGPISQDASATLFRLQSSLGYALLFVLCLQLLNSVDRIRLLAIVIVASGVLQSSYGVMVTLGGQSFDILRTRAQGAAIGDAIGTFANRNHLAGYLEMCLAVGIGLLIASMKDSVADESWRERARNLLRALLGGKGMLRLLLIAMVIALVMTHSRMGNTAFFASMGICAGIGFFIYRRNSQAMVVLFGSMILIDVFIISAWFGLDKLTDRLQQTQVGKEGRLEVTQNALVWIQDHWLTGTGAGSFVSVFPIYRDNNVDGFYDFAHNDYLQLLGEYGVIGASFFGLIAVFTLWTAIQLQRQRKTPLLRGIGFATMMGLISLLIHSTTDFNLYIPSNAALLTVLCAMTFAGSHLDRQAVRKRRRSAAADKATHEDRDEAGEAA